MSDVFADDHHLATAPNREADPFEISPRAFPEHLGEPANPQSPALSGPSSRPSAPLPVPSEDPAIIRELTLLQSIADSLKGSPTALAVTGEAVQAHLTEDYPFAGAKRWLIPRQPQGGKVIVPTTGWVDVRPANRTRTGGTLVVAGAGAIWLALCNAREAAAGAGGGTGMLFLTANGGSWDFRLGPVLWSGAISAIAVVESELAVCEI